MSKLLSASVLTLLCTAVIPLNAPNGQNTLCTDDCEFRIKSEVRIGAMKDSGGVFSDTQMLPRDSHQRYYVLKPAYGDRIFMYDSAGKFLRTIGQPKIPLLRIGALQIGPGDSLHIFDNGLKRHLVITPQHRVAYSDTLLGPTTDVMFLEAGNMIINGTVLSASAIGLPLHYATNGSIRKSFGSLNGTFRPDIAYEGWRVLSFADQKSVWSINKTDPLLERWTTDGKLLQSFRLKLPWFTPWDTGSRFTEKQAPKPLISAARTDKYGRVLLIASVPSPNWKRSIVMKENQDGIHPVPTSWDDALDSYLLIVDPVKQTLVSSTRTSSFLRSFISDSEVVAVKGPVNNSSVSVLLFELVKK